MKDTPSKVISNHVLRFAIFMGLFCGSLNHLDLLLHKLRGKQDSWNSLIAGGVSALPFILFENSDLAMFVASKVIQASIDYVAKGKMREAIPYANLFLFAMAGGFVFFCSVLEPYNLRPSFYTFLNTSANGRYNQFEDIVKAWNLQVFQASGFQYPKKK